MKCPVCGCELTQEFYKKGINFRCAHCGGRMMTVSGLRSLCGDRKFVNMLWQTARYGYSETGPVCSCCKKAMRRVTLPLAGAAIELDLCCSCQLIWFDPSELEQIPPPQPEAAAALPQEAKEALAMRQITVDEARLNATLGNSDQDGPNEGWKYLPALLGMPVEVDAPDCNRKPVVTWSIAVLCLAVFALTLPDLSAAVNGWGFIPAQWSRHGGLTVITSMFLHGGVFHLLGNLYFLLIFGDNVEDEFGHWKYIGLLLASGLCALLLHSLFDLHPNVPCVGASGFISGVIACYAFCFPKVRLSFLIWARSWFAVLVTGRSWWALPAWSVFGIWIVFQFIMSQLPAAGDGGVAYMAHIGGILAGIVFAVGHRLTRKREYQTWMKSLAEREQNKD